MKVLYKYCLIIASVFLLFSCEKETEDISRITYYVDFELNEGAVNFIQAGSSWTDPGVKATEAGVDVTDKVDVSGTVNANKVGRYVITYSAVNKDGFTASAEREVYVVDVTQSAPIQNGAYIVSGSSYRHVNSSGAEVAYGKDFEISFTQVYSGVLYVSDLFGGWYAQRAGYGSAYNMTGYLLFYPDNTLTLLYSHNNGWGDGMDYADGTYDPATGVITLAASYVGSYVFNQTITKK
ncbi:hypothetical protein AGMMS50262_21610 [Bacteroidia bacterium]|nr:hypothetical protein AGMMS50262_21610 [Bacteroidia bacterium]